MVNAREWLDKEYPKSKRSKIEELNISKKWDTPDNDKLTGSLNLTDFINLQKLYCSRNNLTNLNLPKNSKLTEIHCYFNNLTTLTISNHSLLQVLYCSGNKTLTTLTVTNNVNLTKLDCSTCNLTILTLTNNPNLSILECHKNQLTNWDFLTTCHNENNLTNLIIRNNKLTGNLADLAVILNKFSNLETLYLNNNPLTGELSSLTNLTNLQKLYLDNLKITGSLQSLKNCSKLTELRIENTNLTTGLEYLSESLERIYCQGTKLEEELKDYEKGDYYNYQAWRKKYNSKRVKSLEEENLKLSSLENEVERLTNLIKEQKDKIITAYTHFFSEKQLLQQLITAHLAYKKVQEGKIKLRKQRESLYNELTEKVSEELMEKVEFILEDCEQLIHYEKELQAEINTNQRLITHRERVIQQITYNISNLNTNQGNILIGNQIGDNANLSYQIQKILESKIEIHPK